MKSGHIVLILAGLVVVGGIAYAFMRDGAGMPVQQAAAESQGTVRKLVHVGELAAKPEDFKGEILLRAAVAAVKESEGVMSVIDAREFKSCGVVTCAESYLPVKFTGKLPQTKTIVEITGHVGKTGKGFVFEASRVDVVP